MIDQNAIGKREEQRKENAEEDGEECIDGVKELAQDVAQDGFFGWSTWLATLPMSFPEQSRPASEANRLTVSLTGGATLLT